jgi:hypothetical protein
MSEDDPSLTDFWIGDYLNRSDEAKYLTRYLAARYHVKKNEQGFVLAVNGDWGLGKSFMIERWCKELEHATHPVVMFNSWENDFTPEPLVAFIAELNSALSKQFDKLPKAEELRKSWLKKAKAVLIPTLKVAGMAAFKHSTGMVITEATELYSGSEDDVGDVEEKNPAIDTKEIAEKLAEAIDDELKSHSNVKSAIVDFKSRLSTLVEYLEGQSGVQLPIFIFIDELDRCRPDYAIKLLEGIKHLFGIPGIHFIVATNLSELAHSVRAIYGERFSAERYLKRFFDMEYSLPEPNGLEFATQLMAPIAELPNAKFVTGLEQVFRHDQFPAKNLSFIFTRYAISFGLRLRDQQQVAKLLEASILTLDESPIHVHFLFFLASLYQKNSQLYHEVMKVRSVVGNTKFMENVPDSFLGPFPIQENVNYETTRSVSVAEVAEVYFSFLQGSQTILNRPHEFPAVLLLNSRTQQDRENFLSYIDIVRRAGQFLK